MFNLKFIYALVFTSLAGWAIFAYITTSEIIKSQKIYANIVNVTGKQRMLSQRIALMAHRYYHAHDNAKKEQLHALYESMKSDHEFISSKYVKSETARTIYYGEDRRLDKNVKRFLGLVERFLINEDLSTLQELEALSFALLPILNEAVIVFENESREKTDLLLARELFILVGILVTLILESIFIVVPSIRKTELHEDELKHMVKARTLELEKLSVTDKLTNLYNRRKIDETITFELERAKRNKSTFSVIIIDIDRFKNVNDTYGHKVGDYVLQEIAGILTKNVRKIDMLGRWGGEEFLIIDTSPHPEKVISFAEKVRKAIEQHKFDNIGQVTCSFGVTHYIEGDTDSSIVIRSDKALYKAKDAGRNCVRELVA